MFLSSLLAEAGFGDSRVLLPITDPYVRHHAALGSFATVYLSAANSSPQRLQTAMQAIRNTNGVYTVMSRAEAARAFELAPDRIGDIVVVADTNTGLCFFLSDPLLPSLFLTRRLSLCAVLCSVGPCSGRSRPDSDRRHSALARRLE